MGLLREALSGPTAVPLLSDDLRTPPSSKDRTHQVVYSGFVLVTAGSVR